MEIKERRFMKENTGITISTPEVLRNRVTSKEKEAWLPNCDHFIFSYGDNCNKIISTRNFNTIRHTIDLDTSVKRLRKEKVHGSNLSFINIISEDDRDFLAVSDLIRRVLNFNKSNHLDASVILIFRKIDEWMKGLVEKDRVQLLLDSINVDEWNEDSLVAVLSSTLPWKSKLSNRIEFISNVRGMLMNKYQDREKVDRILEGL